MPVVEKTYYNQLLDSLFSEHDELVAVTLQLFHKLGVPVKEEAINEFILSHPDYPSLLCISDCLKQWKVDNLALKLDKAQLDNYPLPMLVNVSGEFKVVVGIEASHILYLNRYNKVVKGSRDEFFTKWNGIALLIDNADHEKISEKEKGSRMNTKKSSFSLFMGISLFFLAIASVIYSFSHSLQQLIAYGFLLVLNFSGIIISSLLLWYQADKNNPLLKKICGSGKSDTGCGAVLDSRFSKLWGNLGWSEVGFFYFTGSLLSLLLFPQFIVYTAWLNVLALPYVIFSISYQKFVAKKWCPLCLAVQGVLVVSFIASLSGGFLSSLPGLSAYVIFNLALLFLLPVAVWYMVKPFLTGYQKNKYSRYELARLKNDPRVFSRISQEQKKIALPAPDLGITLGRKDARHTIIKVCNPNCAPCARSHGELKELLKHTNDIKVQVIFTATNEPGDNRTAPVKHLLAISSAENERRTEQALDDWYMAKQKNYETFAAKYPMNGELKKQDEKISKMAEWCEAAGISFTPTIFVNGYQLPEMYQLDDLKYILRNLDE